MNNCESKNVKKNEKLVHFLISYWNARVEYKLNNSVGMDKLNVLRKKILTLVTRKQFHPLYKKFNNSLQNYRMLINDKKKIKQINDSIINRINEFSNEIYPQTEIKLNNDKHNVEAIKDDKTKRNELKNYLSDYWNFIVEFNDTDNMTVNDFDDGNSKYKKLLSEYLTSEQIHIIYKKFIHLANKDWENNVDKLNDELKDYFYEVINTRFPKPIIVKNENVQQEWNKNIESQQQNIDIYLEKPSLESIVNQLQQTIEKLQQSIDVIKNNKLE